MIDIITEVDKVYDLYERGIITAEQFEEQRKALFAQQIKDVSDTPMVRIGPAYKSFWKNSFRWNGRATRAELFWPMLVNSVVGFILFFLMGLTKSPIFYILYIMFCIASLFPGLAVYARRFHDIGHTAKFGFLPYLVALGLALIAIVFQCIDYAIRPDVMPRILLMIRSLIFIVGGFSLGFFGLFWWAFMIFPTQMKTNKWGEPR